MKVCCFGEVLLRVALSQNWLSHNALPYYLGGAELNVATALAQWGLPVTYVTAVPDNYVGADIAAQIANLGIENKNIVHSGNRVGLYYLNQGTDIKSGGVVYDREYSSFSGLWPGSIDWDVVFEGCSWFHFSAINPSLNDNLALICKEAVLAAAARGITVSIDLNYREKLWQNGREPLSVLPELAQYCNVIMGNIWSVEKLLGIPSPLPTSEGTSFESLNNAAFKSIAHIKENFTNAGTVALTYRLQDSYWGVLEQKGDSAVSATYNITHVTDRVGSGDCFMAGLIYALGNGYSPNDTVNFAAAAAVGKLGEAGDATRQSVADIKNRIKNG